MGTVFWISYVALWLLVVLAIIGVLGLYYHFAQIYLNSREGRIDGQGPQVSEVAPPMQYTADGNGRPVNDGVAKVMVFVSDDCHLCNSIQLELSHSDQQELAQSDGIVFVDGSEDSVAKWRSVIPLTWKVIRDKKGKVAVRYHIQSTPYAFSLDSDNIVVAKGNVNQVTEIVEKFNATAITNELEVTE
jgi:hypothetical protein